METVLEFPSLCFVDTLDNLDGQQQGATGGAVTRQGSFNLGGLSEENWIRIQEQNEKPISVIIGNPPYNDSAKIWGDDSDNRGYSEIDKRIQETYVKEGTAQRTHQYDMYKRFLRWASDRLADDGIIGFITNRAYLETRQDDGFRRVAAGEFTDIYVMDLGSDVRRNPKISGTSHNVFGIQTGVAIAFFVREKAKLGDCGIHYVRREDTELAKEKLAFLKDSVLESIPFVDITPDAKSNWLSQSNINFAKLIALANRQAKLGQFRDLRVPVFELVTPAVKSNRDGWVYDFDPGNLRDKAIFFTATYNKFLEEQDGSFDPVIKWSDSLRDSFQRGETTVYDDGNRVESLWRPYVKKWYLAEPMLNDRLTRNHYELFGSNLHQPNQIINFCTNGKDFYALAADRLSDFHFTGDTQCLPLYRYTAEGERASNITEWAVRRINEHYRAEWSEDYGRIVGEEGITAEQIFAYTYAVLHDPVYRHEYAVDLLREFPRLPFYRDFHHWAEMGQNLLDLHIGFESVEPYPLERYDREDVDPTRAILRADKKQGTITLDERTTLVGIPEKSWEYRLGSRSALEWVLDQYKERKPRDPTILEKFNTYRFSDHKERVIDLLQRVCTVSVATMDIVDGMAHPEGARPLSVGGSAIEIGQTHLSD